MKNYILILIASVLALCSSCCGTYGVEVREPIVYERVYERVPYPHRPVIAPPIIIHRHEARSHHTPIPQHKPVPQRPPVRTGRYHRR